MKRNRGTLGKGEISKEFGKVRRPIDSWTGHESCVRIKHVDAQQSDI